MNIQSKNQPHNKEVIIKATGFREYDARWLYPQDINLPGMYVLGLSLGTLLHENNITPKIVVGHDFRSYSEDIKKALVEGLLASGCKVLDIGLALSPTAYFAQFDLDCPAVAMVTASHNENGWTGVKMGMSRPLTFGPDEMYRLKEIALNDLGKTRTGGSYQSIGGIKERYLEDLTKDGAIKRPLKVVAAAGNGTAGAFAPEALRKIGCEVVELHCDLDWTFPNYNPNPEDMKMLHALSQKVLEAHADVGFAFDGDGDRCGVVDNQGHEIFADKVGVMIARDLAANYPNKQFVADVKSTGLFHSDPVLQKLGAKTDYWKTGHSYIKRRVNELNAIAGFEKSGHFFYSPPIGRGYDDGIVSAISICRMLDRAPEKSMADLKNDLPHTWGSPTMAPYCPDEQKYSVVEMVTSIFSSMKRSGQKIMNQEIINLVTVNGVRVTLEDGTWGLVRASSNKPSLVVVVESPASEANMKAMFSEIDSILSEIPQVGEYDQKI